ncbi:MAG: hypothetical protein IJV22_00900 [Bacteroidales bacterium]|nr:hypothetical protein [Bacteroidales bacterium]
MPIQKIETNYSHFPSPAEKTIYFCSRKTKQNTASPPKQLKTIINMISTLAIQGKVIWTALALGILIVIGISTYLKENALTREDDAKTKGKE